IVLAMFALLAAVSPALRGFGPCARRASRQRRAPSAHSLLGLRPGWSRWAPVVRSGRQQEATML
ncbi:hypothetical protein ABZ630_32440, partial [Streptomyces albidoflavus]|uniref:hypothetical protein n=1 Tax=Streptomyces albidoflavus TaxID=1886 RepID=UPI0033C6A911